MNIVFLYTELAEYFLSCIRELLKQYKVNVHIVRWPLNSEAPFSFDIPDAVSLYDRNKYDEKSLIQLIDNISPHLVFCSGWIDKAYTRVAVHCRKKRIPVVAGIDNIWTGSLRQQAARLISPFTFLRYFDYMWVAGEPQREYAEKLGFKPGQIISGYYSADFDFFNQQYEKNKQFKLEHFPHRFIYVGRYIEIKGILELWEAFAGAVAETKSDWELWCLGTGPLMQGAPVHSQIKHIGFVQPGDMIEYIRRTGVFVLPSWEEPWGVVVHEFAASGFPLLCSDKVGAATFFLRDGWNGYSFKAKDVHSLKKVLVKIMNSSDTDLFNMGGRSAKMAPKNTPGIWAKKLMSLT